MKKIFILLLIPIIITGCTKKENTPINLDKKMDISVSTYQDDNPITVGLYEDEYLAIINKQSGVVVLPSLISIILIKKS